MIAAAIALAMVVGVAGIVVWRRRSRPVIGVVDPRAVAMWALLDSKRPCPRVQWVQPDPSSPGGNSVKQGKIWVAGWWLGGSVVYVVRGRHEGHALPHELVHAFGLPDHTPEFYTWTNMLEASVP